MQKNIVDLFNPWKILFIFGSCFLFLTLCSVVTLKILQKPSREYWLKIENLEKDVKLLRDELESLQGKVDTLEGQVSGIHSIFIPRKSCDTISPVSRSQRKHKIYPNGGDEPGVYVLCDFDTDNGGWTVIQKRSSGPEDEFYKNWTEYEQGFGSLDGNFWIGLKTIHDLTKDGDQELRIDLWDFEGDYVYEKYSNFSIWDSSDFYRLTVGGYSGTAGDSLSYNNGMKFSTKDKNNDGSSEVNCAIYSRGAWWYKGCTFSTLNGFYYVKGETQIKAVGSGVWWWQWKNSVHSLRQVEMKIRSRR